MAYDEELAARVRRVLGRHRGIEEQRMFGGLTFLWNRQMVAGVLDDRLVLRLGDDLAVAALAEEHVHPFDFTGRPMRSIVYVDGAGIAADADLRRWISLALDFVKTLPPKK